MNLNELETNYEFERNTAEGAWAVHPAGRNRGGGNNNSKNVKEKIVKEFQQFHFPKPLGKCSFCAPHLF